MSNRSTIAIENKDGSVWQIYCHWDGSVEHNGIILYTNYNDIKKINDLMNMGAVSVLGLHVHPSGTHNYKNREPDVCVFYGRDNNEKNIDKEIYQNLKDFLVEMVNVENNYLYKTKNKKWYLISEDKSLLPLRLEIKKKLKSSGCDKEFIDLFTLYEKKNKTIFELNKLNKELKFSLTTDNLIKI